MKISRETLAGLVVVAIVAGGATGCSSRKKEVQEAPVFSAPERYAQGLELIEQHKLGKAVRVLSGITNYTPENRVELEPKVRLALADATYYRGTDLAWIDSRALYLDFVTLYGDHPAAPYAQFQAGICSLRQVNHPARDQSQTYRALRDMGEVYRRYPQSPYASAARVMSHKAKINLALHEVQVGRFYLKRKKYPAAVERFRKALEELPATANREQPYFYLGQALLRSNNTEEGRLYLDKVIADYPEGKFVEEARKQLTAIGGAPQIGLTATP